MGSSWLPRGLMNDRLNFGDGCSGRFPIFAPYACTRLVDPSVLFVEVTLLAMLAKVSMSASRMARPIFWPRAARKCSRETLPAAFLSPPIARASAASRSVGLSCPPIGSCHLIFSERNISSVQAACGHQRRCEPPCRGGLKHRLPSTGNLMPRLLAY